MALFEGKTPAERNKLIAAIALPVVMLVFIFYMFSGPSRPNGAAASPTPRPAPRRTGNQTNANNSPDATEVDPGTLTPVIVEQAAYDGPDGDRNIFAFYEKPVAPAVPTASVTPPPTPTPTPPLVLASLAPQSVFASTGNFTLQVSGDKFGPGVSVFVDGQQVPTQYKSMQQLTATVPAAAISSSGPRQVKVMTPDGKLYSNTSTLTVMQPPAPTYVYVGLLKRARSNTAVLKDQKGELYSVHEGDIVEGRFRVAAISERGVDVVDKDLNIKHTLPFTASAAGGLQGRAPGSIQPPSSEEGDEEP
ncbi:MAG TPA: IPT/TIG domain-containing protein [Pyrinomonadaceae bacterium]|nr:IPT/TIG domain-containing protein [Pyrinomonadaceae bacterium]